MHELSRCSSSDSETPLATINITKRAGKRLANKSYVCMLFGFRVHRWATPLITGGEPCTLRLNSTSSTSGLSHPVPQSPYTIVHSASTVGPSKIARQRIQLLLGVQSTAGMQVSYFRYVQKYIAFYQNIVRIDGRLPKRLSVYDR